MEKDAPEKDTIQLRCSCGEETLDVQYSREDREYFLALWYYGRSGHPLCWSERFRWIKRIFFTGTPWADAVILTEQQMLDLAKFVLDTQTKQ